MKNLYKDQIRKIKFNLFNFISLSILVIVISLSFTAIQTTLVRLEENYDPFLEAQNVEDFQFKLSSVDIDLLGGTALWYLCEELEMEFTCASYISDGREAAMTNLNHLINQRIEERPDLVEGLVEKYIDDITTEHDFIVEEKLVSDVQDGDFQYRFLSLTTTIDIPYVVEGVLPEDDYEIAIFPEFAEHNNIKVGDTLTIRDTDYLITAFAYTPDYVFPVYYMNPMDIEYETVVLTSTSTLEALDENIEVRYVGTGDLSDVFDAKTYNDVVETDVSSLGTTTQHIKSIRPATANYKIAMLYLEVENGKIFMNAFMFMFMIFIGILFTIFLKRYIDKNKKDIDTLQSLGYTNTEISKSLMIFPVLISAMSFVGYIIGLLVSYIVFDSYAARYLFPKASFSLQFTSFIIAVIVPILFISLVSYLFVSLNLRRKQKKSIHRLKLKVFKFTPTKTLIQTFGLLLIVSSMVLFATNAKSMFTDFTETTKLGNNFEEAIRLDYFTNDELLDEYEPFTRLKASNTLVNGLEQEFSFNLYGIDSTTTLKALIDNDASQNVLLNDGIIISEYLRYKKNLDIGDELQFSVKGTEYTYIVVAITNELIENNAFILREDLNTSYLLDDSYYNGIYTTDDQYQSDNISIRVNYNQGITDMESTLRTSSNIVYLILFLSAVLGLLMFGFILSNYLSDNRKNIAILKSIGYNSKEINNKYILVIILTFILAFIVAIPCTNLLFDLLLKNIINQLGYILILNVAFINIVISFVLMALIFIIALFIINKYYDKVTITEILKAEEK